MSLEQTVQRLADRQDILDCRVRYCRAIDRCDMELLTTVYHDDAIDDHSSFIGDFRSFGEWAMTFNRDRAYMTQHCILNHYCELDGDIAHTETYWLFACMNREGPELSLRGGRYLDRFERRNGRWAIAQAKTITDWLGTPGSLPVTEEQTRNFNAAGNPTQDRNDLSYERPLQISPDRLSKAQFYRR